MEYAEGLFIRWSASHWAALSVIVSVSFLFIFLCCRMCCEAHDRARAGRIFSIFLAVVWLVNSFMPFLIFGMDGWRSRLPLHFCNVMFPVCCAALWFRWRWACCLSYFGIMTACVQALATPVPIQAFPGIQFFSFFASHGLLLTAGFFIPLVSGWRYERWDAVRALLLGDVYLACMIPLNFWLGSNYGFTRIAPPGSILQYAGEPPWYYLTLQLPALGVFLLLSLPVRCRKVIV